jgi:putative DNA methylase
MTLIKTPKKLIEVALPLDAINKASSREKSIRHGHPSTLHLWWARRPLATARAVIFAQMVNDPGYQQGGGFKYGVNKEKAEIERERLFKIIEDLVVWENSNNEEVLARARKEIVRSWRETCELNCGHPQAKELFNPDKLPDFHDPFAGGGAIPLEAQRLGLHSYASDLNPVAVTINKAMIEIPSRFADLTPVGPRLKGDNQVNLSEDWSGAKGLAEDLRRYGSWVCSEAYKRIGHMYPQIEITDLIAKDRPDLKNLVGQKLTVIAWLWARTVKSPNPAFSHVHVPLATTFVLSSKSGKEVYVDPIINEDSYQFSVKIGTPPKLALNGTKLARGANFRCVLSDSPIDQSYIREEFIAKRTGTRLMAIVAEGKGSRIYLPPTPEQEAIAHQAIPPWRPEQQMEQRSKDLLSGRGYGFTEWHELFTPRQLLTLTTFSDLVQEAVDLCREDALAAGFSKDARGLDELGNGATAYAQAIGVYLSFAVSKISNIGSSIASWMNDRGAFRETFARQAIPMVWDFAEANTFADAGGSFETAIDKGSMAVRDFPRAGKGSALQADAASQNVSTNKVVSTDPPYYDNIGYADLSDFFYIWLRKILKPIFPSLYVTLAVPKAEELVATPYRHGGKAEAEAFFLNGMTKAMHNLAVQAHPAFPLTIYYAFKQAETKGEAGTHSTGWETFLEAVLSAGFAITGTWPMRTEGSGRMIGQGNNALASSIILVCRKRAIDAPSVSRREFLRQLNSALPEALLDMTRGGTNSPVAPVDLSQAIIGPGMAIFSQYASVLEADGKSMSVRTALQLINRFFAEDDFDSDTQFCLHWFESQGYATGKFGDADVLARAKGTSVGGLQQAGVIESSAGNLRLLRWAELPKDWSPDRDDRTPVWESLHQLIRALNQDGETVAGALLSRMPAHAEPIRALAYRLFTLCERKGWSEEARAYNELVAAWNSIEQSATDAGIVGSQAKLDI